jgi:hypothetical protein
LLSRNAAILDRASSAGLDLRRQTGASQVVTICQSPMEMTMKLTIEQLEERIAPSGMGDTSDNNNPGENNTNLEGNQPTDGGGGGGDTADNNNPPLNNTNNPGNEGTGGEVSTG